MRSGTRGEKVANRNGKYSDNQKRDAEIDRNQFSCVANNIISGKQVNLNRPKKLKSEYNENNCIGF